MDEFEMFGNPITGYTTEYYCRLIEEKLTKLNEARPFYLDITNGHNTNNQPSKKNLYKRMQNK
jgi:hypothetical protein